MRRRSLVLIALWALSLTLRGGETISSAGPEVTALPAVSAGPAGASRTALGQAMDAPMVGRIVGDWNPSLSRAERDRIGDAVMRCNRRYGLDPTLVTAVIWVESRGRPWARSPKGALGLMQVMPYMAEPLGLAGNFTTIESNIEAGCRILSDNIERLGEADGVSAYFWGSNIRGVSYLNRVREARERVRQELRS
jgi:soluble lytic murein transglycosylase-like protein